jgi:hypothetical protein
MAAYRHSRAWGQPPCEAHALLPWPVGPRQILGALTPSQSKQGFNAKKQMKVEKIAKKASLALRAVFDWAPR